MLGYLSANNDLLRDDLEYTIFTAIEPIAPHDARLKAFESIEDFLHEQAEAVLHPIRSFVQMQGWNARLEYAPGNAVDAIAAKAEALDPGLIVMGTHGRSPIGSLLLGSVAQGVLAKCKAPVLLIR
jgi:nucleotide-binding universal stress UspA family protein